MLLSFVILSFLSVLSVHAATIHHAPHLLHRRAAVRARQLQGPTLGKRQSKKCKSHFSSSSLVASSSSSSQAAPTTSSTFAPIANPAPVPTSSHKDSPAPTPSPSPTSTKAAPAPTTSQSSGDNNNGGGSGGIGGFLAGVNTGADLTFYDLGLTACGQTYTNNDLVAAISFLSFQKVPGSNGNPNLNPICGRKAKVSYQGKSVVVAIVDECMGCMIADSLDLSPAAFNQLADPSAGRVSGATWEFV